MARYMIKIVVWNSPYPDVLVMSGTMAEAKERAKAHMKTISRPIRSVLIEGPEESIRMHRPTKTSTEWLDDNQIQDYISNQLYQKSKN
jgi:hypothetical protein